MDICQTNCLSRHKGATWGVLGGQPFKSLGKLSDWHHLWFTSADSSGNGHRLNTSRPSIPQGHLWGGGVRVSHIQKLGNLSKGCTDWHQMLHSYADPSGNVYTPNKLPHETQWGHLGVLGVKHSSLGKLSNGWTDWHQLWFTSADSSGNGHRLSQSRPSIPQGAFGGMGGHKFKSLGKLSNGCIDWHQIWYTLADSSGNGRRLNTIRPTIPQVHYGRGLRGHQFKCLGKLSNGWTNIPVGILGGHKLKIMLLKLSNGWTDWHQIWHTCADSSGNGYRQNKLPFENTRVALGVFKGSNIQKS